jgi:hypothetical protein
VLAVGFADCQHPKIFFSPALEGVGKAWLSDFEKAVTNFVSAYFPLVVLFTTFKTLVYFF